MDWSNPGRRMAGLRGLRALLRVLLRLTLIAPFVALFLSVLVDRGASGDVRLSRFPLALLAVDPLVGTCARNSIIFAVVLSFASFGLGSALGWILGRRSFWGRPLLQGAILGLLVASPAIMAFGIVGMLGPEKSWPWPFTNMAGADRGVSLESWAGLGVWLVWLWSSLPAATALVAAATTSAVLRLEPSWEDAARLAGASTFHSWRTVSWPLYRPPAVRAAAWVFALGLLEPGAPLILGLRRTLAYQIVEAASRSAPFPRIAAWSLLAGLIALLGTVVLRLFSGTPIITNSVASDRSPGTHKLPRPAPLSRAAGSIAILAVWCLFAWLPVLGIVRLAWSASDAQSGSNGGAGGFLSVTASRLDEPPVRRVLIDSALVGAEVAGTILIVFWLAGSGRGGRGEPARINERGSRWAIALAAPALVVGVGVLAIPWVAEAAVGWLAAGGGTGAGVGDSLASIAGWIAPFGTPSLFVPVSVAWVLGPLLFLCWRSAPTSRGAACSAIDAARLFGASRVRALWMGAPSLAATWVGRFAMAWALAATNLTPALLASPGTDGPTLAPAFLILADGQRDARSLAAGLALGILALNAVALAVAWACGALPALEGCEPP